jgi:hypothetical protein
VLVLIDESGDPGFKLDRGSSSHFVLAMVIFSDYQEAERASVAIAQAKTVLRVGKEFKFSSCADRVRDGFFEAVQPCNFVVRALVVDKALIRSHHLQENTERFYNFFVQLLLRHDGGAVAAARVKIDKCGDRRFKAELNSYLRRQLPKGQVATIKFVDSCSDNLLQLADMCSGAILRASRSDDRRNVRWLAALRASRKIQDIWPFQ